MNWEISAVAASMLMALYASVNQKYRLPGHRLIIWRGLVPIIVLGPFLPLFAPPVDPLFYRFVAINAVLVYFFDTWLFEAVKRFGVELPLRLNPVTVFFIFFAWLMLDSGQATLMHDHPWQFAGIFFALLIGLLALSRMAKCSVTADAMRFYLPCLIIGVFVDIFNKKAMQHANSVSGPLYYAVVISSLIFIMTLPRMINSIRKNGDAINLKATWVPGLLIGISGIGLMLSKNIAMDRTPNPAYVTAIIMASPVWVTLYARLRGKPDRSGLGWWLIFLASTIAIVLLANGLQHSGSA